MGKRRGLLDEYRFPGFRPRAAVKGIFGDPKARGIRLERTQKKRYVAHVVLFTGVTTTRGCGGFGICLAGTREYTWRWRFGASGARGVGR